MCIRYDMPNLRCSILLGVPVPSAFVRLASSPEIVQFLQVDLGNLLLAVCCLAESTRLSEHRNRLSQGLDSHYT